MKNKRQIQRQNKKQNKRLLALRNYSVIGVVVLIIALLLVKKNRPFETTKSINDSVVFDEGSFPKRSDEIKNPSDSTKVETGSLIPDRAEKTNSDRIYEEVARGSNSEIKDEVITFTKQRNKIDNEGRVPQKIPLSVKVRDEKIKPDPLASFEKELEPRKPHPAITLIIPKGKQIRLNVKFMDGVMARSIGENQMEVSGLKHDDLNPLIELSHSHDLVYSPAFDSPESIDDLRVLAARRSGEMQADLNGTMLVDLPANTHSLKIAQALQDLDFIESVDIESLDMPPPPPADIAPTTPNLEPQQGHLGNNPGFGVNDLKALGADGTGVKFSDCEYGFNPDHEDLEDANLVDGSRAAINPSVYTNGWDDHGTAALGITVAQENGYGVTGIAPGCEAAFYSEWTTSGYSRTNSVSDAVMGSEAGDVILLEMQAAGNGGSAYVPAEYNSTIWNLCKTATDAGIIVVAAAGNGNQNLDAAFYQPYMARGNSGAIIVGAGSNDTGHSKLSFSTYGSRVDIQAWGTSVMTTGYGNYAKYGNDENQSYTSSFSGTSSASACAAGAVVLMQSYAKKNLNTTFTPEEMRTHLKANAHNQGGSGGNIGSAIALNLAANGLPGGSPRLVISSPNSDDISLSCLDLLPFRSYKIEESQNLNQWNNLILNISSSSGQVDQLRTDEAKNYPKRFYRLREE